jgi:DHA2 family multidrug resistance protein-like MFS transporter
VVVENQDAVPARAGRKEWVGLAVIAIACLIYVMDLSVLYLAVPSLTRDLQPSSAQLLWITDIYGFLVAGFLITMGTLGDRIGRRRILLIGAAGFGAASLLAAFSTSAEMLIGRPAARSASSQEACYWRTSGGGRCSLSTCPPWRCC